MMATDIFVARPSRALILRRKTQMQKPDFSGEWTLNREASALSPVVAPVVQGGFVKIDHREPTVSVHLSIKMDGKPFERAIRAELRVGWRRPDLHRQDPDP